ncbi:MAG TPA: MopE-related protein [Polyangiaceae bacterium]
MRRFPIAFSLLALTSSWFVALACGSRTGLLPGRVVAAAGGEPGFDAGPDVTTAECQLASDCPQPPPGSCGAAACVGGACELSISQVCDDGDPCTLDSCEQKMCVVVDGRVDADGDGAFASGSSSDPTAALGCGLDCDDANPDVFPDALELCDALDNDCNGVVDEGTQLQLTSAAPVQVSPADAERAGASGLAFDGERFGATMTLGRAGKKQGHFRLLDSQGNPQGDTQRIARVNAESYGGLLAWSGQHYLTAYEDARQADNYEVYFDVLNRDGLRLIDDLRLTEADDFSLNPSLVWTGTEALIVWDDRRFEGDMDGAAIMGQRLSSEGKPIGGNVRLTPPGVRGEAPRIALSDTGVAIAFVMPEGDDLTRVGFMTASRQLENPSSPIAVDVVNAVDPEVTAVGGKFVVTFHQEDSSIGPAIFGAVIGANGVERGPLSMTAGGLHARSHSTYSYGDRFVMVWADTKDGPYQLYAQTFDPNLKPLSQRLRVVSSGTQTLNPVLAPAADGGLGILYDDDGSVGQRAVFFTRLDCQQAAQR